MNRRLLSAVLLTPGLTPGGIDVLCAGGRSQTPQAEASAPPPTPSPNFSTIRMSTIGVECDRSHSDITTGTFLAGQASNVRVRESFDAMGRSSAAWLFHADSETITRATNRPASRLPAFPGERLTGSHGAKGQRGFPMGRPGACT